MRGKEQHKSSSFDNQGQDPKETARHSCSDRRSGGLQRPNAGQIRIRVKRFQPERAPKGRGEMRQSGGNCGDSSNGRVGLYAITGQMVCAPSMRHRCIRTMEGRADLSAISTL